MSRAGLTKTSTLGAWPWQKRGLHGSPKKYPDELVERGVRLALESERPIAQIAADLGMHPRRREARELRAAPDVCEWDYGRLALRPGRDQAATPQRRDPAPRTGVDQRSVRVDVPRCRRRDHKLKPHQVRPFKFSKDPQLTEKIVGVVGLYMDPPKGALVLCVDEKTQIQALDRTQPTLPIKPGKAAGMTHDYKRNGTTSLYAALEVATGEVTGACYPQHRHQEFLAFLNQLVRAYPRRPLHVVLDNSSTHSTPEVQAWLARHKRATSTSLRPRRRG
jgi:transposase-like protein